MKIEHKSLKFAVALAVLVPACYINTEKPADSAPPVGSATAAPTLATAAPPLVTTTASANTTPSAVPTTRPRPPSLIAAPKPAPTASATP